MTAPDLVLRDVHVPVAPPLWPPAPGWWVLAAVLLLAGAALAWWLRSRRRRRRALGSLFDDTLDAAVTPPERVAAISGLLRRAARLHDADATRLQGEPWLEWLDANTCVPGFGHRHAGLLLEGGWRRDLPDDDVGALEADARRAWHHLVIERGGARSAWTRWPASRRRGRAAATEAPR